jgi:hypothetical protein
VPVVAVQAVEIQLAAQEVPEYHLQSVVHHWPMPAAVAAGLGIPAAPESADQESVVLVQEMILAQVMQEQPIEGLVQVPAVADLVEQCQVAHQE